jgi:hypothetical protein
MHRPVHVREARAGAQRGKTAAIVFAETGVTEASAPTTPPGMKKVTRSEGEPADRAEAKSESETKATAESEE